MFESLSSTPCGQYVQVLTPRARSGRPAKCGQALHSVVVIEKAIAYRHPLARPSGLPSIARSVWPCSANDDGRGRPHLAAPRSRDTGPCDELTSIWSIPCSRLRLSDSDAEWSRVVSCSRVCRGSERVPHGFFGMPRDARAPCIWQADISSTCRAFSESLTCPPSPCPAARPRSSPKGDLRCSRTVLPVSIV